MANEDRLSALAAQDRYGFDEPSAYLPDVPTGPDEPIMTERQRSQRAAQLARQGEGVNPVVDIIKSIPAAAARGAKSFLLQAGSGADPIPFMPEVSQEQQRLGIAGAHEAARQMEEGIQENLYQPQTLPGHYGHSVVEIGTNPINWVGPGSIPFKAGWNVVSGLGGEAGAQAYKGTPYEDTARIAGSFSPMVAERAAALAPGALAKLPGAVEAAFNAAVPSNAAGVIGGRIPRAPPQMIRPAVNENIPAPVRERAQMRDELAAGKRAYEETLPPSRVVLPEDFLRTAVERKTAAPGELAAQDALPPGAGNTNLPVAQRTQDTLQTLRNVQREHDLNEAMRPVDERTEAALAAIRDALQPIRRQDVVRDPSGRPVRTAPLPLGIEDRILEEGLKAATGLRPVGPQPPLMQAAARMGGLVEPSAPQGIRAYHSSPHDFERFDISKVGTGQGAQSYGHGIYVAENPAVSGQGGEYWREFLRRFPDPELHAAQRLRASNFDRDRAIQSARLGLKDAEFKEARSKEWNKFVQKYPGLEPEVAKLEAAQRAQRSPYSEATKIRQAIDLLESGKPVGPRTYEVNINARPEQFLEHGTPIGKQSPEVRKSLEGYLGGAYLDTPNVFPQSIVPTGIVGAKSLRDAGIPGIKYLDQGSRGAENWVLRHPQGGTFEYPTEQAAKQFLARNPEYALEAPKRTSNYVLFDDKLIDILRKYGIAGMLGGGAMGATAAQDKYQQ